MKYLYIPIALSLCAIMLLSGCGKSGDSPITPTPPKPVAKTTVQLLEASPWKISKVYYTNETTNLLWPVGVPDSLANLVLTLNTDGTFTQTGAKTASGTWTYVTVPNPVLTLATTSAPVSTIPWTFTVSATALSYANVFIQTTYQNPDDPLQSYVGETVQYTH